MEEKLVDINPSDTNNDINVSADYKYDLMSSKNKITEPQFEIILQPFLFVFASEYIIFLLLLINCTCIDYSDNTLVLFSIINNFCIPIDFIHLYTFLKMIMRKKLLDDKKHRNNNYNSIVTPNTRCETFFLIFWIHKLFVVEIYYTYLIISKFSVITDIMFKCLFIGHYAYFAVLFLIYNYYFFNHIRN